MKTIYNNNKKIHKQWSFKKTKQRRKKKHTLRSVHKKITNNRLCQQFCSTNLCKLKHHSEAIEYLLVELGLRQIPYIFDLTFCIWFDPKLVLNNWNTLAHKLYVRAWNRTITHKKNTTHSKKKPTNEMKTNYGQREIICKKKPIQRNWFKWCKNWANQRTQKAHIDEQIFKIHNDCYAFFIVNK